jgi:spermidine/putrescine transport system permease protein
MIKIAVTPEVNALSALFMLLTLTMIVLAGKIAPDVLRPKTD